MRRFYALLLLIVSIVSLGFCSEMEFSFLENLAEAVPGEFIVTLYGKTYTLFHIRSKSDRHIIVEEVSTPKFGNGIVWRSWFEQGAPKHTSWIVYSINLDTGKMDECYSLSNNSWLDVSYADIFLSTLMTLKFSPVSERERRRLGPQSCEGVDHRSYWNPKMVVDGEVIPKILFDAWKSLWPDDGTELARKEIEVYLPRDNQNYCDYFPYWLQISNSFGRATVRIVDSGKGLSFPHEEF